MAMIREINIKPSCMSEIHGFPSDQAAQLWEKINYLVENPLPDGKLKKKLHAKNDLYRLRVGDYRVFYTFGDTWVRLLGIRTRKDKTIYNLKGMEVDQPVKTPDDTDHDLDHIQERPAVKPQFQMSSEETTTWLPQKMTAEWLKELKVPEGLHPLLCSCETEEALLALDIPGYVLERIVDNLFPKPIEEVETQPDLVVQSTTDLIRYKEGDLVSFLLKLDKDQENLVKWALNGPTMVKGGAGTGKSTIALYRIKAFFERPGASETDRVLFTTYTRALMNASKQLLQQLLTEEQFKRVHIATCDSVAMDIVKKQRNVRYVTSGSDLEIILAGIRSDYIPDAPSGFERKLKENALNKLSDSYLIEEFDWIIDGRSLSSLDEYLETPRPGRGMVFKKGLRTSVWEIHEKFVQHIKEKEIDRFADIRLEALSCVQQDKDVECYDYVVVDEAQDLSPASLCLMAEMAKSKEGLFFASDDKQSIYSRGYGLVNIHPRLQFKGRTALLKKNYRSTEEIDKAAFDILDPEENEILESSLGVHSGPVPVLLRNVAPQDEGIWVRQFLKQISSHLHLKASSAAVLVPSKASASIIEETLNNLGVSAKCYNGSNLDLNSDKVKILTLHSAKGLEFPIVIICGLPPGKLLYKKNVSDEIFDERLRQERRLLYVGMTRAMRGLMVVQNQMCEHHALSNLDTENWHVEDVK